MIFSLKKYFSCSFDCCFLCILKRESYLSLCACHSSGVTTKQYSCLKFCRVDNHVMYKNLHKEAGVNKEKGCLFSNWDYKSDIRRKDECGQQREVLLAGGPQGFQELSTVTESFLMKLASIHILNLKIQLKAWTTIISGWTILQWLWRDCIRTHLIRKESIAAVLLPLSLYQLFGFSFHHHIIAW